jgi:hypothetical protein
LIIEENRIFCFSWISGFSLIGNEIDFFGNFFQKGSCDKIFIRKIDFFEHTNSLKRVIQARCIPNLGIVKCRIVFKSNSSVISPIEILAEICERTSSIYN